MMKKYRIWLTVIALCYAGFVSGQEKDTTYWKNSEKIGLNFSQASFSNNWKGGGNNSISFGTLFLGKLNYNKDVISWDTELDLQYGILKNKNQNSRKSNDRILFDSKLGYKIAKNWNAFTSLNFQSQFDKGYEYGVDENGAETRSLISGFMSPAYITSSWGAEYKPNDYFSLRLAPFSPRVTILSDTSIYHQVPENYGVEIGETVRYEWLAFNLVASFDKDLVKDINFRARYEFFANYQEFEARRFDHRLDAGITAKIFKVVNLSLMSTVLYDFDQINEVQASFSTALSILVILGNDTGD